MRNLKSIPRAEGLQHLESHLPNSRLDFGKAISDGFQSWKKDAGPFIGFGILSLIISSVLSFIPFIGQIASSLLITPALSLGGYLYAHKVRQDDRREFGDFFKGFDYIGELVISGLILFGFAIAIFLPLGLGAYLVTDLSGFDFNNPSFSPVIIIAIVIVSIILIYLSMLLVNTYHFIGFYNVSGWEAVKYSAKYGHKNWFQIFALVLVTSLIIGLGLLGFIVGIFITYSFMYPISYEGFRQLTNLDEFISEGRSDDMISDHLSSF